MSCSILTASSSVATGKGIAPSLEECKSDQVIENYKEARLVLIVPGLNRREENHGTLEHTRVNTHISSVIV